MVWPADTSVRQTCLDNFVTNLKGINGVEFKQDVGDRVFLYEGERIATGTATPSLFVVPGEERPDHHECINTIAHDLAVAVLCAVSTVGDAWKTTLSDLVADVILTIELDRQLSLAATFTEHHRADIYDQMGGLATAQVLVVIHYRHATTDPSVNAS